MIQKQTIALPFVSGLDTKTDPKLLESPKLRLLQNGLFTKPGRLSKRNGYTTLTSSAVSGSLTSIEAHGTFKNELLSFQGDKVYGYSEQIGKHVSKGTVSSVSSDIVYVSANPSTYQNADYATNGGITVYAFDSQNQNGDPVNVYAAIFDESSQTFIAAETILNTSGGSNEASKPVVVSMGQYIYVFYGFYNGSVGSLRYRRLSLADPTTFESEQSVPSGSLATNLAVFDVQSIDSNRAAIAYDNGTRLCFGVFDGSLSAPTFSPDTSTLADRAGPVLSIVVEPNTLNSWVLYTVPTVQNLKYFIFSTTQTVVLTSTAITNASYPFVESATGEFNSSSQLMVFFHCRFSDTRRFAPAAVNTGTSEITLNDHGFFDGLKVRFTSSGGLPTGLSAGVDYFVIPTGANTFKLATTEVKALSATADVTLSSQGTGTHTILPQLNAATDDSVLWVRSIRYNTCTSAGVVGTETALLHQAQLASRAFKYNGSKYFWVTVERKTQYVYLLIKEDGSIVGKAFPDRAVSKSAPRNKPTFSKVSLISGAKYGWAAPYRTRQEGTVIYRGVARVNVDFLSAEKYFSEEPSNQVQVSGSFVSVYDGASANEAGFHVYPDSSLVLSGGGGGSINAADYYYSAVYEYTDAQGNIWQSSPDFVLASGKVTATASDAHYLRILTLPHTGKVNAQLAIYATVGGGTIKLRLPSVSYRYENSTTFISSVSVVPNSTTARYVVVKVTASVPSTQPALYTESGELENLPPPPAKMLARNNNRLFVINAEDPQEVWFSKFNYGNNAIAFNDTLTKRLNGFGPVRGIAPLDDKVVLFTASTIHWFSGDGPLDTGEQDTFTDINLITTDAGCDNPDSLVQMPEGIMFQSPKGIYLLGRDLSVTYAGASVEEYNSNSVTSATLLKDKNQIRFTSTGTNPALVYDYFLKQWSLFSNHDASDAILWKGNFTYAKKNTGTIYVQSTNFNDNGTTFPLTIETPWIKVQNVQNFQRIRRLLVLGDFKSDHKLKVSIAYDFQDGYSDIVTWDAGAAIAASTLGSEALLGDGSLLGGQADATYQASIHIPRQKCEAIKFLIQDVNDGDLLESFNISHMALEVGVKDGTYKVRSEKTAGS